MLFTIICIETIIIFFLFIRERYKRIKIEKTLKEVRDRIIDMEDKEVKTK